MDENIMVTDEIMDTASEVVETTGGGKGLKALGGVALIAGLAYGGYRLFKRFKNKKAAEKELATYLDEKPKVNED